tara:strand:- start:14 stop:115 length:102 start_codon:yes stop_codon:yes gene_type:complete
MEMETGITTVMSTPGKQTTLLRPGMGDAWPGAM